MADQIINPSRDNQFNSYFTRIPQTGPNATNGVLKTRLLDVFNRTIHEVTTPGINLSELRVPYKGHLDTVFPGDTFQFDPITLTLYLDKDGYAYSYLLNWSLIQKDVIEGNAQNSNFEVKDVYGELVFELLDVGLNPTMKIRYEVLVQNIPPVTFTTKNTKPENIILPVTLTVTNVLNLNFYKTGS